MLALLLDAGGNPVVSDHYGFTPLHAAVDAGIAENIAVLLHHGAPVDAKNDDGLTALEMAIRQGDQALVSILVKVGTDSWHALDYGIRTSSTGRRGVGGTSSP